MRMNNTYKKELNFKKIERGPMHPFNIRYYEDETPDFRIDTKHEIIFFK